MSLCLNFEMPFVSLRHSEENWPIIFGVEFIWRYVDGIVHGYRVETVVSFPV